MAALEALGELAARIPHKTFTKVQEQVIPSLISSNENVVVAAPTGSGKTLLLEVAMLRLFRSRLLAAGPVDATAHPSSQSKAVYICPIKALAYEKYDHWRVIFSPLSVVIETGDQDQFQQRMEAGEQAKRDNDHLTGVAEADIIITTPERWDSITRRWKEKTVLSIVNCVELLLLDEVHTVHEDRGAALEAVVSRMRAIKAQQLSVAGAGAPHTRLVESAGSSQSGPAAKHGAGCYTPRVRFVAISGTLPNITDFAEWLQVKAPFVFSFAATDRPVPLTIKVLGFPSNSSSPFAFDRFLSFKLFGLLRQYSEGKPAIVFCASRKEAAGSAQRLVADLRAQAISDGAECQLEPSAAVLERVNRAVDKQLRQCLLVGIAFHHAALTPSDRQLVESMFRDQYIAAICTTTTLALGVNLPAHLVIVKGTTFFKSGKRDDVQLSEVAQMCGRAGRPGLDAHGVALVLTTQDKASTYQHLSHGDVFTTVESRLHQSMIEHVNAEVALRTIHSFESGLEWIRTTFFWIRLQKSPSTYGLRFRTKAEELAFEPQAFAERLMQKVLSALRDEECIDVQTRTSATLLGGTGPPQRACAGEKNSAGCDSTGADFSTVGTVIESTRIGRDMSRMYILFDTVKTFNEELRLRLAGLSGLWRGPSGVEQAPEDDTDEEAGLADGQDHKAAQPSVLSTDCSDVHADGQSEQLRDAGGAVVTIRREAGDKESVNGGAAAAADTPPLRLFAQGAGPAHLKKRFRFKDVLALCCHCAEFAEVGLRQGDRGPLNEINKNVKFPIKSGHKGGRDVRENWHKPYVLLQSQLEQTALSEVTLRNDVTRLWSVVPRMCRFLCEYARCSCSYTFFVYANLLLRCVEQRVWPDGLITKQLDGVTDAVAKSLSRAGIRTFEDLLSTETCKLEAVCGRLPPYGSQLRSEASATPRLALTLQLVAPSAADGIRYRISITPTQLHVTVASSSRIAKTGADRAGKAKRKADRGFLLLAGAPQEDCLLLYRFVPASTLSSLIENSSGGGDRRISPVCFEFAVPASLLASRKSFIEVTLAVDHWVGSDVSLVLPTGATLQPGDVVRSTDTPEGTTGAAPFFTNGKSLYAYFSVEQPVPSKTSKDACPKESSTHPGGVPDRQRSQKYALKRLPGVEVKHSEPARPEKRRTVASTAEKEHRDPHKEGLTDAADSRSEKSQCDGARAREDQAAPTAFDGLMRDLRFIEGKELQPDSSYRKFAVQPQPRDCPANPTKQSPEPPAECQVCTPMSGAKEITSARTTGLSAAFPTAALPAARTGDGLKKRSRAPEGDYADAGYSASLPRQETESSAEAAGRTSHGSLRSRVLLTDSGCAAASPGRLVAARVRRCDSPNPRQQQQHAPGGPAVASFPAFSAMEREHRDVNSTPYNRLPFQPVVHSSLLQAPACRSWPTDGVYMDTAQQYYVPLSDAGDRARPVPSPDLYPSDAQRTCLAGQPSSRFRFAVGRRTDMPRAEPPTAAQSSVYFTDARSENCWNSTAARPFAQSDAPVPVNPHALAHAAGGPWPRGWQGEHAAAACQPTFDYEFRTPQYSSARSLDPRQSQYVGQEQTANTYGSFTDGQRQVFERAPPTYLYPTRAHTRRGGYSSSRDSWSEHAPLQAEIWPYAYGRGEAQYSVRGSSAVHQRYRDSAPGSDTSSLDPRSARRLMPPAHIRRSWW